MRKPSGERKWQEIMAMVGNMVEVHQKGREERHGLLEYVGNGHLDLLCSDGDSTETEHEKVRIERCDVLECRLIRPQANDGQYLEEAA